MVLEQSADTRSQLHANTVRDAGAGDANIIVFNTMQHAIDGGLGHRQLSACALTQADVPDRHHMAVYLTGVYGDEDSRERFTSAYKDSVKLLHMEESCVRFRKLDDLPLELVGEAIAEFSVEDLHGLTERVRR